MSEKNHFVVWKGIRSGPFTKEALERQFTEGEIGLVRTVLVGGTPVSGRDFVADLETKRREEELEEQLQQQAREAEAVRLELERQQESAQRPTGKTIPPPVPDFNPWAPQQPPPVSSQQTGGAPRRPGPPDPLRPWWDGKWPVIIASVFCLLCLLTGQILREATGIVAITLAVILLIRKRTVPGIVLILCALFSYGLGFLLSDLIHDYLTKNYPN